MQDARRPTDRARIADIAHRAALAVPGVVRLESAPGGAFTTIGPGGESLEGVSCTADAAGGYSVELRLVTGLVPLHPLAERIVERTRAAATAAGLGGSIGEVDVVFADIQVGEPQ
jgi:hypothetical protein